MAVAECVAKLVQTGQITREIADEAMALYERSKGEFTRQHGPARAEAAAGLAVARAMEAGAKKLKNDAAAQALGFANFERTAMQHRDGLIAGVMDQLSASLRGSGTRNVDSVREDIWNQLAAKFGDAMRKFAPGVTGSTQAQIAAARNLIREVFGASTGDATAAAAAKSWGEARTFAEQRALAAGRRFEANESWRVPQPWQSEQVRKVAAEEFKRDFRQELDSGGIARLWDTRNGRPARAEEIDFILDRAYRDIRSSGGSTGVFAREMRTFEFAEGEAGAAAWLRLQAKYGVGDNVFGTLTGHLSHMASEIALAEVIAPNHRAVIAAMMPKLRDADADVKGVRRFKPTRLLESPAMVQKTYDVLTGRANAVEGPVIAGIFGGLRSINTASRLGGAIISAVPGDSVTTLFASSHNGIPATRVLAGVVRELARGGPDSKALAARMNLVAHSSMDYGHGYRFFQDQVAGPAQLRWLATTVIRAQGLQAWTEMLKRTFSMEFMGHLADHAGHNLDALRGVNKPLADFLDRYQITAAEWDAIRATPALEVEGATFLDSTAIADQRLGEKLRTAVIQERRYAVLEPDARIRAITTGGLPQGTFMGEIARNLFLFKSFSLTMIATHVMRVASQETTAEMVKLGTSFLLMSSIAGAASIQARNIIYGRDPENMADPKFWARSFMQGGGTGLYGDYLNSAFSRGGRSFITELAGPIGGVIDDTSRLTFGNARDLAEGKDTRIGAELSRIGRRYTPNVLYTRLATDRLIWDQIQTMIDPEYRRSFRRLEQRAKRERGQEFWWGPGDALPARAPDLGAAVGP